MQRLCLLCGEKVDAWREAPLLGIALDYLDRIKSVGSCISRFQCPHCDGTDRERHLVLYLERLGILPPLIGGNLLHVAPEHRLTSILRDTIKAPLYVCGDLAYSAPEIVDIQSLSFSDNTFRLVIANHVLEHVENFELALREVFRVLEPGGRFICQTPYAEHLSTTFEDPLLQSPDDRLFFYAQEDHVRMFGSDIAAHFVEAGFVGRLVYHNEVLPDVDPEEYGVNEREPFFDFVRPIFNGKEGRLRLPIRDRLRKKRTLA